MKQIQEVEHKGLLWINLNKQSEGPLKELQEKFGFDEQDVKESLPPFQRPKIVKRADYYFLVLHFPVFDRETRKLGFTEVDFFLNANYLVTVHDNKLPALAEFFEECKKDSSVCAGYFHGTAVNILFELLNRLLENIFPILLHINEDINLVDKKLFNRDTGMEMVEEILRLKTNIVAFRRSMQGHRTVLERLIMYSGRDLDVASYMEKVNIIREFTGEIWHMLESQKESIDALYETNEALVSLRTKEVMKMLTIISVFVFPPTLLATLFGSNMISNPFARNSYGFWILFLMIAACVGGMAYVFKKKRWI